MNISVIIPFYNSGSYLERAVNSALDQPETGEVILVNDGSTDQSLEIARALGSKCEKVKLFELDRNYGPAKARNHGVQHAQFPVIAFLDADDLFLNKRFASSIIRLSNKNTVVIYGTTLNRFDSNELRKSYMKIYENETDRIYLSMPPTNVSFFETLALSKHGNIHLNAITITKELFVEVGGFDESLIQMEDTDFILRLALIADFHGLDPTDALAIRNIHGENVVLTVPDKTELRLKFLKKWIFLSLRNRSSIRVILHFLRSYLGEHPFAGRGTFNPFKTAFLKFILLLRLTMHPTNG